MDNVVYMYIMCLLKESIWLCGGGEWEEIMNMTLG